MQKNKWFTSDPCSVYDLCDSAVLQISNWTLLPGGTGISRGIGQEGTFTTEMLGKGQAKVGNSGDSEHRKVLLNGEKIKKWDWVESSPRKGREFFPIKPHTHRCQDPKLRLGLLILYLPCDCTLCMSQSLQKVPVFRSCPGRSDLNLRWWDPAAP